MGLPASCALAILAIALATQVATQAPDLCDKPATSVTAPGRAQCKTPSPRGGAPKHAFPAPL